MGYRVRRVIRTTSLVAALWSVGVAQVVAGGWTGSHATPAPLDTSVLRLGFAAGDVPRLAEGRAAARELESTDSSELAATGVVVLPARVDDVVERFRDLSILRRSGMAACAGRFSGEPILDDLTCLEIPADDLVLLSKAKVGDSDVKLSAAEIGTLRTANGACADVEFKKALMRRVLAWQQNGLAGLTNYSDKRKPIAQTEVTTALVSTLEADRPVPAERVESFQYWAVEKFGDFKPLVDVNDVAIFTGPGIVRIETTQLYASHYCNGLVTSVDLIPIETATGPATLMRLTFRVRMDSLGGFFGGLKRHIGRGRVVDQVADGLERVRAAVA